MGEAAGRPPRAWGCRRGLVNLSSFFHRQTERGSEGKSGLAPCSLRLLSPSSSRSFLTTCLRSAQGWEALSSPRPHPQHCAGARRPQGEAGKGERFFDPQLKCIHKNESLFSSKEADTWEAVCKFKRFANFPPWAPLSRLRHVFPHILRVNVPASFQSRFNFGKLPKDIRG